MSTLTYIVKANASENPGGVELEYVSLSDFGLTIGIHTEIATTEEILQKALPGDVVYIQEEGRLSAEYRNWAVALLNRAVVIIEKNVFALPSKFRPIHKNYHMVLMSKDGAFRYILRSTMIGNKQEKLLIVPNLPFWFSSSEIEEPYESRETKTAIKILRAGRPDTKKWTRVEVEKFIQLFGGREQNLAKLSLVGAPDSIVEFAKSLTTEIECIPYTNSISNYYKSSDTYFLYSRIGETFGNTIFEAVEYGLGVVFVFNLKWDCAPIEYLSELTSKSEIFEISNISKLNRTSFRHKSESRNDGPGSHFRDKNSDLFRGNYKSLEIVRPKFVRSVGYIYKLGRKYQVRFPKIIYVLILEVIRESFLKRYVRGLT
jgi:hypothetical protein